MRYQPFFCDKLAKTRQIKGGGRFERYSSPSIGRLQGGNKLSERRDKTGLQPRLFANCIQMPAGVASQLEMLRVDNQQRRFVKRLDDI